MRATLLLETTRVIVENRVTPKDQTDEAESSVQFVKGMRAQDLFKDVEDAAASSSKDRPTRQERASRSLILRTSILVGCAAIDGLEKGCGLEHVNRLRYLRLDELPFGHSCLVFRCLTVQLTIRLAGFVLDLSRDSSCTEQY